MSQNAAAIFQEAVQLCKDEKYEEAIQLIDTLLQYQPQHRLGLFVRGSIRIQHQQVRESMLDWEAAFDGIDRQAAQRVQQQYPELVDIALNHFAFETTVDPNDPLRHAAYGKAARYFDKFEQAQRHLLRAFEIDKYYWKEALLAAELHKALGENEAALQLLQKLQELHPENAEIQYRTAAFHQQSNSTAFALRHLEKAVALDPSHADARYALGAIYVQQGRSEQAITQLYSSIKLKPTAAGHCRLAEAHQQLYQFDEALNNYRLAAELEPENFKLLCDLGALALQFGDLELGISSLRKAVAIDPKHPDVHAHLAKAALQSGDLAEATTSYQKLLDLTPDDVFALRSLASIYLTQNNPAVAIPLLTRAKNLNASDVQVWIDLARAYRLSDNAVSSKQILREALELYPNNLALQQESMCDPSSSEQEMVSALPPVRELSFEEHFNLGRAARDAGNSDDALKAFSQALALQPSDPDCLEAVALLYRDKGLTAPAADFMRQSFCLTPDRQDRLEVFSALLDDLIDFERDEVLDEFFQSETVIPQEILEKTAHLSGAGIQAIRKRFPEYTQAETHQGVPEPHQQQEADSEPVAAETEPMLSAAQEEDSAPITVAEILSNEQPQTEESVDGASSEEHGAPEIAATTLEERVPEETPAAAAEWLSEPESPEPQAADDTPSAADEVLFAVDLLETETSDTDSIEVQEPASSSQFESLESADLVQAASAGSSAEEPAMLETAPQSPTHPPTELASLPTSTHSEELSELQASLEELQSELLRRGLELEGQQEELERQKAELQSREQKLSLLEQQVQSKSVQLQWETEELQERQSKLSQAELDLSAQQAAIQASSTAIADREQELQKRIESLTQHEEALRAREAAVTKQEAEYSAKLNEIQNRATTPVPEVPAASPKMEPDVKDQEPESISVAVAATATIVNIPSLSVQAEPAGVEAPTTVTEAEAVAADDKTGPGDLAALSLLLDKDPEYANSVELAWQLSKENESDFLALFRELSRPSNADPRHSRNFALAYLHQNRPLLAVVQLQKYLQKSPSASGYRLLADVYQRMNRQSNVDDCIRRAEALEAQG